MDDPQKNKIHFFLVNSLRTVHHPERNCGYKCKNTLYKKKTCIFRRGLRVVCACGIVWSFCCFSSLYSVTLLFLKVVKRRHAQKKPYPNNLSVVLFSNKVPSYSKVGTETKCPSSDAFKYKAKLFGIEIYIPNAVVCLLLELWRKLTSSFWFHRTKSFDLSAHKDTVLKPPALETWWGVRFKIQVLHTFNMVRKKKELLGH